MARRLFIFSATRRRTSGAIASGVSYVVYSDEAAVTPADISLTSGGAAIPGSAVTTADITGLGLAAVRFYGPPDDTTNLWLRCPDNSALGVQELTADADARLDDLEAAGSGSVAVHNADTTFVHGIADTTAVNDSLHALLGPQTIPDLVGWYAADQLGGLADGAAVATWPDGSGAGAVAVQGTSASRPTFQTAELNGHPIVRFDGTNDHLKAGLAHVFDGSDAAVSVVAVLKFTDLAGFYTFLGLGRASDVLPGWEFRHAPSSGGVYAAIKRDDASASVAVASGATTTDTSFHVLSFVVPGTTIGLWEDGSAVIAAGTGFDVGATTLDVAAIGATIFGGSASNYLKGDLAELLVFNRALATAERQQLEWYFGLKYGLTIASGSFNAADQLPLDTPYRGSANLAQFVIREPLTQAVLDAKRATGGIVRVPAGINLVDNSAAALTWHQGVKIKGEAAGFTGGVADGSILTATSGTNALFQIPPNTGGYDMADVKLHGGLHSVAFDDAVGGCSFLFFDKVKFGPVDTGLYISAGNGIERLYMTNCEMGGGDYCFRMLNTGANALFDKSSFTNCVFNGAGINHFKVECRVSNNVTWQDCWFHTAGQHGFYADGGIRGWSFINANTEGGGQDGKNNRTTLVGTVSSGATSATLASGTGWVTGDVMTIAGAGASGVDLAKTVTVAGTAVSWTGGTSTTVTDPAVTNAIYDDFHFNNSIASASLVSFESGLLGGEGSGGHLRYSVHWPDSGFISFKDCSATANTPIYDPGKRARVFSGQAVVRRPGYTSGDAQDLWPVAGAPTITGSRAGNAALASLLTELAKRGLIVDSSS